MIRFITPNNQFSFLIWNINHSISACVLSVLYDVYSKNRKLSGLYFYINSRSIVGVDVYKTKYVLRYVTNSRSGKHGLAKFFLNKLSGSNGQYGDIHGRFDDINEDSTYDWQAGDKILVSDPSFCNPGKKCTNYLRLILRTTTLWENCLWMLTNRGNPIKHKKKKIQDDISMSCFVRTLTQAAEKFGRRAAKKNAIKGAK